MDSTLKSNISVGLPLDLLVYEADALRVTRFVNIDEKNAYFRMIRDTWGSACARFRRDQRSAVGCFPAGRIPAGPPGEAALGPAGARAPAAPGHAA